MIFSISIYLELYLFEEFVLTNLFVTPTSISLNNFLFIIGRFGFTWRIWVGFSSFEIWAGNLLKMKQIIGSIKYKTKVNISFNAFKGIVI